MNFNPRVSIIIPTYNRSELLKGVILSAINQTYKNIEIIIVDDGSIDGTKKSIADFNDERIIYIRHDKNMGVSVARNTGIKKSTGESIFLIDDDDLIAPQTLEKLLDKINKSKIENLGAAYGWSLWLDDKNRNAKIMAYKFSGKIFDKISKKQIFTNLLVKKQALEDVGLYNQNLRNNEDLDFYLRLAKKYNFDFVPEILCVIRGHGEQHLSEFNQKNIENFYKISKSFSLKKIIIGWLPKNIYISISKIKNKFFLYIQYFLHPGIVKEIKSVKKMLKQEGIKI